MHLSIRRQCDANHRMRPPNAELRRREHLTEAEVERLKEAAKGNRYALGIRWDSRTATLHVRRVKKGTSSTHPILGDELRALRRLRREPSPPFRVHLGAGRTVYDRRVCPHGGTGGQ